ncbi:hypothetical protein P8C59_005080 [Phyllachora maydis]|uniref:Uncharacterized protein n=2 Tax=Phyllachora maydis TaxID=1825666 RepID=A0AAD9I3Q6_9PEZI|nr:hypothetical protein P8C59_005080 [Phyllachora maydis]
MARKANIRSRIDPALLENDDDGNDVAGSEEVAAEDEDEDEDDDEDDEDDDDNNNNGDDTDNDHLSQVSGADSDLADLQEDIRRQDREQYVFASLQHEAAALGLGQAAPRSAAAVLPSAPAGKREVRKRGSRKPPQPPVNIVYRLSKAKEAFERDDYDLTIAILEEIIQEAAETWQAWMFLVRVHEERGDRRRAVIARVGAAHLLHRDAANWVNTARYVLDGVDEATDEAARRTAYETASACYSQALSIERDQVEARMGKADLLLLLGKATLAMQQYERLLRYRPLNIQSVRNMADVALDSRDPHRSCEVARAAYRRIIDHCQTHNTQEVEGGSFEWSDLRIYLEFFTSLELWDAGARELKAVARWLLGRRAETHWDSWTDDDREWDLTDDRRVHVAQFRPTQYPQDTYGLGLPVDLRAKLYVYRLKLDQDTEARMHHRVLDPGRDTAEEEYRAFPDCLRDMGAALVEKQRAEEALPFFQLYRAIGRTNAEVLTDAEFLAAQGRCHLLLGDKMAAEECFIAAIEDDEDDIEALVELAKLYEAEEAAEGREQAFLLVNEALNLEAQRSSGPDGAEGENRRRRRAAVRSKTKLARAVQADGRPKDRGRYRPKRLLNQKLRLQQEREAMEEVGHRFRQMEGLRGAMAQQDEGAMQAWMGMARELIEDFRSFKQLYPWEKYVKFMGYSKPTGKDEKANRWSGLTAMAVRLEQDLAPAEEEQEARPARELPREHRGIPLENWLDVFLEYALALARSGQAREAYSVCHAARDSVVYTDPANTFRIHLAWATCAIYAGDEETCVAVGRYFMRVYAPGTDSYRMFAALCRLCQSPISWYTSGPAQKFFLRQIKSMDEIIGLKRQKRKKKKTKKREEKRQTKRPRRAEPGADEDDEDDEDEDDEDDDDDDDPDPDLGDLDVCLLTMYGQILYTTGSFWYSMTYFARALSVDPDNVLVNMMMGLAYLHHAFQRQAKNRQYALAQGFAFLFRYYHGRLEDGRCTPGQRQEAHFNMGRAYNMVGLGHLAVDYYAKVLDEATAEARRTGAPEGDPVRIVDPVLGRDDLAVEAAYNIRTMAYMMGDLEGASAITRQWLVL